jgi:hypothetical protein
VLERSAVDEAGALPAYYQALLRRLVTQGSPPGWTELDVAQARQRIASTIGRELAYGYETMPAATAAALAGDFTALFSRGARYFAHHDSFRISPSNFDYGIAALDGDCVGLLWIESDSPGR